MTPTEILKEEHEVILKMIKIIKTICDKKYFKKDNVLKDIVEFIQDFTDRCHHAKEEKILFKEAAKYGIPEDGGPIGVMIAEHKEGRIYVMAMANAIEKGSWEEYKSNALSYAELLEEHISKENNILYPMIDMHVPEKVQNKVLKEFEKIEKNEIDPGMHEKYHKMVNRLESFIGT